MKERSMRSKTVSRRKLLDLALFAVPLIAGYPAFAASGQRSERSYRQIADGLRFPEGPVAASDGAVFLSEIAEGRITRIEPDGRRDVVAEPGGGPNGLAFGPDGWLYCCNGGGFSWTETETMLTPGGIADDYRGGRIERIEPNTGTVEKLYETVDGHRLSAPNDLVFDDHGGFWFTDAATSTDREQMHGGVYYAKADGSKIREVVYPVASPNGIGLSPDGARLYIALTTWREIREFTITAPGEITVAPGSLIPGRAVTSFSSNRLLDSMAIEASGNVCVARLLDDSGISTVAPDGRLVEHVPLPDLLTTNICFGGPDMTTAYVTQSSTGRLLALDWPRPGLKLRHNTNSH